MKVQDGWIGKYEISSCGMERDWGGITGNETREEGLAVEIFIVLLEVFFARRAELDGCELVALLILSSRSSLELLSDFSLRTHGSRSGR